jgi:hypothetical protein
MSQEIKSTRSNSQTGLILLLLGLALLFGQIVDWDGIALAIPALLGLAFLVMGALTRRSGLMVPGGILSGIGLGTLVISGPLSHLPLIARHEDSWFLVTFALGWVLITVATALFGEKTYRWPLIPAAIMAVIAASLVVGGTLETVLSYAGKAWPLILILLGLNLLWNSRRQDESREKPIV